MVEKALQRDSGTGLILRDGNEPATGCPGADEEFDECCECCFEENSTITWEFTRTITVWTSTDGSCTGTSCTCIIDWDQVTLTRTAAAAGHVAWSKPGVPYTRDQGDCDGCGPNDSGSIAARYDCNNCRWSWEDPFTTGFVTVHANATDCNGYSGPTNIEHSCIPDGSGDFEESNTMTIGAPTPPGCWNGTQCVSGDGGDDGAC